MQADVDTVSKARPIAIHGVNGIGHDSDNALVCDGRVIPWLQDEPAQNVWVSWAVQYRDVVVLDATNRVIRAYNLTDRNLADPPNYAELRTILVEAARAVP